MTSYGALVEGDNASLFIHGVTENQIFYDAYHVKGEWEPGMTSEEYEALLEKDSFVLDLQTKEVRHNDLPEPVLVHDGYYYYNRDNALYSHCLADGKETMIAERMFQTEEGYPVPMRMGNFLSANVRLPAPPWTHTFDVMT
ncbi:MAG: hypothetical protein ACLR23_19535 [Clostridia bacterium]